MSLPTLSKSPEDIKVLRSKFINAIFLKNYLRNCVNKIMWIRWNFWKIVPTKFNERNQVYK